MSLYQSQPCNAKLSRKKLQRISRRSQRLTNATRALFSLSQQWKRYPNSKAIVDVRLGNKTQTDLYPEGYDPFFMFTKSVLHLPIKGYPKSDMKHVKDRDVIVLSDKDPGKGLCLSFWSDNEARIERFKHLCRANLPKELSWFHQSNARQYQMFEFWKPHTLVAFIYGQRIAKELGMQFKVEVDGSYATPMDIEQKPHERFDPMMHIFGDFAGQ